MEIKNALRRRSDQGLNPLEIDLAIKENRS